MCVPVYRLFVWSSQKVVSNFYVKYENVIEKQYIFYNIWIRECKNCGVIEKENLCRKFVLSTNMSCRSFKRSEDYNRLQIKILGYKKANNQHVLQKQSKNIKIAVGFYNEK